MSLQSCAVKCAIEHLEKKGEKLKLPCTGVCKTCLQTKRVYGTKGEKILCLKSKVC